jgi:uncharacterized protein (TIGR03435 family)
MNRRTGLRRILTLIVTILGQFTTPAAAQPAFEVASIKRSTALSQDMKIVPTPGGRLNGENLTLKFLIGISYKIGDNQIQGGPSWIASARYDIAAKAETAKQFPDFSPMLQTLLEDRLKLAVHHETKEQSVYVLTAAKEGLKLRSTDAQSGSGTIGMTSKRMEGTGIAMESLARALARITGMVVIDQTGFNGKFDVDLAWAPDDEGDSLFTVLREQLGIKLESRKAPVDVLVIDHAEKPSEN